MKGYIMVKGYIMEELVPKYDSHKSFYGKATVREHDVYATLVSYTTDVALIKFTDYMFSDQTVRSVQVLTDALTPTTLRHVKEFLKQYGVRAESKTQIIDDYGTTELVYY